MPDHDVTSPAAMARAILAQTKAGLCRHGVPKSHCNDCTETTPADAAARKGWAGEAE